MDQIIYEHLSKSRYFDDFSEEILQHILKFAQIKQFNAGETILAQGEANQEVYFIIQGVASVWIDHRFIYPLRRKGDLFGEMSVITGSPCQNTIQAHEDLLVIALSSDLIQTIQRDASHKLHYILYKWFCRVLAEKIDLASEKAKLYEDTIVELRLQKEQMELSLQTVRQQRNQMLRDLDQARETHKIILPEYIPKIQNAKIAYKFAPWNQVGGDFYDILKLGKDRFGILVADVTGHGISAALISILVSNVFKDSALGIPSPEWVLNITNGKLYGKLPEGKFVSMFYGIYDSTRQVLTYSNAGHPPVLVIRPQSKEIFFLKGSGMVIGPFPSKITGFEEKTFQCLPGDKLLFYTDGIIEAKNDKEQLLGAKGLLQYLEGHWNSSIDQLIEQICEFCLDFSNSHEFEDDVTLVGLEVFENK